MRLVWCFFFSPLSSDRVKEPFQPLFLRFNQDSYGMAVKDYRYCGYAEALAKGPSLAREGIRIVLGLSETISWKEVSQQCRKYLFVQGSLPTKTKQPAFDLAAAQTVVEQKKGELSLPERLRCRIRYLMTFAPALSAAALIPSSIVRNHSVSAVICTAPKVISLA
jgi:hypothetical protein